MRRLCFLSASVRAQIYSLFYSSYSPLFNYNSPAGEEPGREHFKVEALFPALSPCRLKRQLAVTKRSLCDNSFPVTPNTDPHKLPVGLVPHQSILQCRLPSAASTFLSARCALFFFPPTSLLCLNCSCQPFSSLSVPLWWLPYKCHIQSAMLGLTTTGRSGRTDCG